MVAAANGKGPELNIPRMLEAVIIAAVIGAGAWFMLIPELKLEFKHMQNEIHEINDKFDTLQRDVTQLKIDAAVERSRHEK